MTIRPFIDLLSLSSDDDELSSSDEEMLPMYALSTYKLGLPVQLDHHMGAIQGIFSKPILSTLNIAYMIEFAKKDDIDIILAHIEWVTDVWYHVQFKNCHVPVWITESAMHAAIHTCTEVGVQINNTCRYVTYLKQMKPFY